jgi:hypothetical protein
MVAAALLLAVAAMGLVRVGWAGRRRGLPVAGWALAAVALAVLCGEHGAWGLAMGTVAGSVAALALVLHAGWTAPGKARQPRREPPTVTLPHQPAEVLRRLAVFVLVVPVALAASMWLAFGTQAAARGAGAGEADATALMLLGAPIYWSILMTWQMTQATPARMVMPAVAAAGAGTILWGVS